MDKESTHKAALMKLIDKEPDISRSEIHFCLNKEFRWLRKHKRDWIDQMLPPRRSKNKSKSDWRERDAEVLLKLKQGVNTLLSTEEKPIRLTTNKIVRMTGTRILTESPSENMHQSKTFLKSIIESKDEYDIRKVKWAVKQLNLRSEEVVQLKIKKEAGIPNISSQRVAQEIEEQVSNYSNRNQGYCE